MNSNEISVPWRGCCRVKVGHRDEFHSERFSFYGAISCEKFAHNNREREIDSFNSWKVSPKMLRQQALGKNFDLRVSSAKEFAVMADVIIFWATARWIVTCVKMEILNNSSKWWQRTRQSFNLSQPFSWCLRANRDVSVRKTFQQRSCHGVAAPLARWARKYFDNKKLV